MFEGPLAYLEWEMKWLMMSAWADTTKRALSTEYKAFKAYCRIANISSLPVTGHQLAIYASPLPVWTQASSRSTGSNTGASKPPC